MRLIGRDKLKRTGAEVDRWLRSWCAEVAHAHWRSPEDITDQFPNAWIRSDGDFIFPVNASGYSVRLQVAFQHSIALILEMNRIDVPHAT
jgi:mRNA-degrading endonuclease HigB of HigAB toxin-antitoxin module